VPRTIQIPRSRVVMPWPVYQTMMDDDLRAIYEYLLWIPAINANLCGVPSE